MATTKTKENTRASRGTETREKQARRKPWSPPSALDAPPAPEGYKHRWIRTEVRGQSDTKNMSSRLREGYEPVRADEYPDFEAPTIEDGRHAGCIGVGGLILARIPIETVQERKSFFDNKTEGQMEAVDNDYFRDGSHPSMSVAKPNRQTRVTLGGKRSIDDN
jgi:hypothetical protein|tara:strand:- start:694 stop:1182 length:489 start_codon:yes stop_codon:yes gene_type:complete